jgi:hypothetical protein
VSHRYCGRDFHADEIALIRQRIAEDPARTRAELSRCLRPAASDPIRGIGTLAGLMNSASVISTR